MAIRPCKGDLNAFFASFQGQEVLKLDSSKKKEFYDMRLLTYTYLCRVKEQKNFDFNKFWSDVKPEYFKRKGIPTTYPEGEGWKCLTLLPKQAQRKGVFTFVLHEDEKKEKEEKERAEATKRARIDPEQALDLNWLPIMEDPDLGLNEQEDFLLGLTYEDMLI